MGEMADNGYGRASRIETGPLAGYMTWGQGEDPFETLVGLFGYREDEDGRIRIAFQPEPKHLNGAGALHGGLLMSFADFSLFAIAHPILKSGVMAVTLTCNSEFLGAGGLEGLVEAQGEVLRETGGLIFVQGRLSQAKSPLLAFSGVLKKLRG
jgi:uncharacterized protein (TIGR00369 family)